MRIAVLNNGRIKSLIIAESVEIAEEITGGTCAHAETGDIGWLWNEQHGKFLPDQPFASWTWDEVALAWVAPKPKPESEAELAWDEATLSWVEYVEPTPVFEVPLEPIAKMAPEVEEENA